MNGFLHTVPEITGNPKYRYEILGDPRNSNGILRTPRKSQETLRIRLKSLEILGNDLELEVQSFIPSRGRLIIPEKS